MMKLSLVSVAACLVGFTLSVSKTLTIYCYNDFQRILTFRLEVFADPVSSNTRPELPHYSDVSKLNFQTMKYIGPTSPGGPDVELWGTAKVWDTLLQEMWVVINIE